MNDPDPNGDVVLIVSPPTQPPEYRRREAPSSTTIQKADPTAPASLGETSPPHEHDAANELDLNPAPTLRFKVSSRHLVLASSYFENRLKTSWPEGKRLQDERTVELDLPDTNPEALLILLNAIHGHILRVPQVVDLNQLVELAVLVDYLQCHEIVDLFSNLWVEALKESVPSEGTDDVPRWIFISWVFCKADIFRQVTGIAQRQGICGLCTLQLPIPGALKGKIDRSRIEALEAMLKALYSRVERLKGNHVVCEFYCDSAQLGALLKHMNAKGRDPRPGPRFFLSSFDSVAKAISEFKSPKCSKSTSYDKNSGCPRAYKVIVKYLQDEADRIRRYLRGLDLRRYI